MVGVNFGFPKQAPWHRSLREGDRNNSLLSVANITSLWIVSIYSIPQPGQQPNSKQYVDASSQSYFVFASFEHSIENTENYKSFVVCFP